MGTCLTASLKSVRQCERRAEGAIRYAAGVGSRFENCRARARDAFMWCLTWRDVEGNCVGLYAGGRTDRHSQLKHNLARWMFLQVCTSSVRTCFLSMQRFKCHTYMYLPFLCLIPPEMSNLIFIHIPRQHLIQVRLMQIPLVLFIASFLVLTQPVVFTYTLPCPRSLALL